jgi:LPS sulfotransferase NodH
VEITRSVLICSVPRTGSWLLAEALEETGRCGHPREYFRTDYESIYAREWKLPAGHDFAAYLAAVRRAGSTPNGVFATKLHWEQYAAALPRLRSLSPPGRAADDLLRDHFPAPVLVRLHRTDTAAQAVSWYRAIHLDVWWQLDDPTARPDDRLPGEPDLAEIERLERRIIDQDEQWAALLADTALDLVLVTYEELSADYPAAVARVLAAAGLPGVPPPAGPVRLRRQADEVSRAWTDRYLRHRDREPGPCVRTC